MNNNDQAVLNAQSNKKKLLKAQIQKILASENLAGQRMLIKAISAELKITALDCAAALAYLNENQPDQASQRQSGKQSGDGQPAINFAAPDIKLVRYRLNIGHQHQVTVDELKRVLVEESGVDIKNIANVRIQDCYTLIDLPDEMPQEIFHHLKMVEINRQKLDIRRVKARNKKRGNRRHRHARPANLLTAKEGT